MIFQNRQQAGAQLARQLKKYKGKRTVVLAIPRGGVVVGGKVAQALSCPLDVIIPRKVRAPGNPEFAIGAIGPHEQIFLDQKILDQYKIPKDYLNAEIGRQGVEMERRERVYREGRPSLVLKGKTVILVDDGIATGATTRVAIKSIKCQRPKKLILGVPVGPKEAMTVLEKEVDEVVCLATPEPFYAIGQFYQEFDQTTDKEVVGVLRRARKG
jgi:putative phosphoribosyl transferase